MVKKKNARMLKSYKANSKISFNFYFLVLANKQIGFQGCGFCCWLVAPSQDTFWVLSNWLGSSWGMSQVQDSAIKLLGADIHNIHIHIKPTIHFTDTLFDSDSAFASTHHHHGHAIQPSSTLSFSFSWFVPSHVLLFFLWKFFSKVLAIVCIFKITIRKGWTFICLTEMGVWKLYTICFWLFEW